MGKNCGGTGDAQEYQQLSADDAKMLQNAEPWFCEVYMKKRGGPSVLELFFFGVVLLLMYMYIHVYIYMFFTTT